MAEGEVLKANLRQLFVKYWQIPLYLAAIISLTRGIHFGITDSKDIQWFAGTLWVNGENPYNVYLSDEAHRFKGFPEPNYLQALYPLISPIALLDLQTAKIAWILLSLLLFSIAINLLSKQFKWSARQNLLITLLAIISTPFRNTLENGQISILAFFAITLIFHNNFVVRGIGIGITSIKYSFLPALTGWLFGEKRFKESVLGLAFSLLLYIVFFLRLGSFDIRNLIQPLLSAENSMALGNSDLASIVVLGMSEFGLELSKVYTSISVAAVCFVLTFVLVRKFRLGIEHSLALMALMQFAGFIHAIYDFIILIVLVPLVIKSTSKFLRMSLTVTFSWFGFALGLVRLIPIQLNLIVTTFSFLVLLLSIFAILRDAKSFVQKIN